MNEPQAVRTPTWLTLAPAERVLLRTRPSTNLVLASVVGGFLLITLGSLPFIAVSAVDTGRRATFALAALVVLLVLGSFLFVRHREYVVTSNRVAVARGLQSKDVRTVDVENITDVSVAQRRLLGLVNLGTVRFETNGGDPVEFSLVERPSAVYEQVLDYL